MPERSALFQGVQIGVESTSGTAVAANKLLNYLSIDADPSFNMQRFRPMGQAVASTVVPAAESVTFSSTGVGSYSEWVYPFSSLFGAATITTLDTSARQWRWIPTARAEMTPKTYTTEIGGAVRAHKFAFGMWNGFEVTYNRQEGVSSSGSGIGQLLSDNITMTASPTAIEDVPIVANEVDVWIDGTSAGIGTTKLTRDFNVVWRNNDMYGPIWPLNSANASFASVVGTEPTSQMELTMEADSAGMAYLTDLRAASTKYVRVKCTSSRTAGATTQKYEFTVDFAGKFSAEPTFDETDGVFTVNWTLDAIYDAAWGSGQYQVVTLINKLTAL